MAKIILVGVIAFIIGAAAGIGYARIEVNEVNQRLTVVTQERDQALQNSERLRKLNDEAASRYGQNVGKLVIAVPTTDDPEKLIDSARGLLAARDGIRASLEAIRAPMNAEFDDLAIELGSATPNAERLKQLLESLKQNWPAKEKDMEAASRKLLVDLGLLQAPLSASPQAAPEVPPAPAAAPLPAAPAETK